MFRSIRVGNLFGIPLYLHPTFLLLPAWVVLSHPGAGPVAALLLILWILTVFGCVVLHELGHALMARHYGIGTRDITLYPIGGVARLEGMGHKPSQELAIALAGPAVNLVIALLLSPVALVGLFALPGVGLSFNLSLGAAGLAVQFLTLVWASNLGLLLFNLLPCFPMDGGRVLRALLSLGLGRLRATEIAAGVGVVLAGLIGVWGLMTLNLLTVVLAAFVVFAGQQELRAVRWVSPTRQRGNLFQAEPRVVPEPVVPVVRPVILPSAGPAPQELHAGFTGFTWHSETGVWVQWQEGRPVAFWGPQRGGSRME
jgi:Zn-dependent protease